MAALSGSAADDRLLRRILRGVFLKGSGFAVLWPEALVLLGFRTVVLMLASARFHKGLD